MNENIRKLIIFFLDALQIDRCTESWEVGQRVTNLKNKEQFATLYPIDVSDGASKICLIFKNFPFVIKWNPHNGKEAMKEVSIYEDAVKHRLEFFFPETSFFYEYNEVSFVLQEKIDFSAHQMHHETHYMKAINRIIKTPTERIYRKVEREFKKAGHNYHRDLDAVWAKMAISLYGKKAMKALCKFIIQHEINDLHPGNLGYKNLRPVILDFCGYYG